MPGAGVAAYLGADQAVHGEERHLGVIGDRAAPPVGGYQIGHALLAVRLADRVDRVEFDTGTERIADGAAEQTAAYPAAEILLLRAPPDGAAARRAHAGTPLRPASHARGAHFRTARSLRSLTAPS